MADKEDKSGPARAARLHEKIEEIKKDAGKPNAPERSPGPLPSPRDFIHKRMRELKEKK
jgi:sigma54-dependent transcription regulator